MTLAGVAPGASASCFQQSVDLLALADGDGGAGFVLQGSDREHAGNAASNAGDVNGDGIDDLIIGANEADVLAEDDDRGKVYVVFGSDRGLQPEIDLSALTGSDGFALIGVADEDYAGSSVSGAGDVNGDGIDDLIVGTEWANRIGTHAGESYVIFGTDQGFPPSLELATLDGSNGFVLKGIAPADHLGRSVSDAGDINGDGIDDLAVTAPTADIDSGGNQGQTYVIFGTTSGFPPMFDLASLDGSNGFTLNGIVAGDASGSAVSSAGDVNGDGLDDLIIGASEAAPRGPADGHGEAYVVFGSKGGFPRVFELSSLNGKNGFSLVAKRYTRYAGYSVSGAGDVNGDGIDDVIVGAHKSSANYGDNGQSFVVFGSTESFPPHVMLRDLHGTNGFAITGIGPADRSGISVSGAGDINDDGFGDVIIGSYRERLEVAEAYVIFGSPSRFPEEIFLSDLNAIRGFVLQGDRNSIAVGSAAGDVNGDGIADLLVGNPTGNHADDRAYVLFGHASGMCGYVFGVQAQGAGCMNRSAHQTVVTALEPDDPNASWDCEALGLSVSPGDRVGVIVRGTASSPEFNGWATSLETGATVLCKNLTRTDSVHAALREDGHWDCASAGINFEPVYFFFALVNGTVR